VITAGQRPRPDFWHPTGRQDPRTAVRCQLSVFNYLLYRTGSTGRFALVDATAASILTYRC
jgi:hypothetical protein